MDDKLKKAFDGLGVVVEEDSVESSSRTQHEYPFEKAVIIGVDGGKHVVDVYDRINKAALYSSISIVGADSKYGSEMPIEKLGKDIKDKLAVAKAADEAEAQTSIDDANDILDAINLKPTSSDQIGDYELRGLKARVGIIPLMFSWEDINRNEDAVRNKIQKENPNMGYSSMNELPEVVEARALAEEMRKYNKCIRNYVECKVQSILIGTMIDNMSDDKKYKLSIEQAASLGF